MKEMFPIKGTGSYPPIHWHRPKDSDSIVGWVYDFAARGDKDWKPGATQEDINDVGGQAKNIYLLWAHRSSTDKKNVMRGMLILCGSNGVPQQTKNDLKLILKVDRAIVNNQDILVIYFKSSLTNSSEFMYPYDSKSDFWDPRITLTANEVRGFTADAEKWRGKGVMCNKGPNGGFKNLRVANSREFIFGFTEETFNVVEYHKKGDQINIGLKRYEYIPWGGKCQCPDGEEYFVGQLKNKANSDRILACFDGETIWMKYRFNKFSDVPYTFKSVTCKSGNPKLLMGWYNETEDGLKG